MTLLRACLAVLLGVMLGANASAQKRREQQHARTPCLPNFSPRPIRMAIQSLEAAIWEQWTIVPEPEQRQLMMRGIAEMQQHELKTSVETFTRLIDIAPDLSEAWNKRATAYWLLGNFPASLSDICETIKREPRHFGAYSGPRHDPRGNGRVSARGRGLRAGPQVQSAHRRNRRRNRPPEGDGRRRTVRSAGLRPAHGRR